MSNQGSLFHTGTANREEAVPVQAKLLARRDDPPTSKQAAKRVVESGRLTSQQYDVLSIVQGCVPGTAKEMFRSSGVLSAEQERFYYTICRRLPELERKGLVRVQQDPSKPCRCKPGAKRCRCRDVVRENSRVWEAVP